MNSPDDVHRRHVAVAMFEAAGCDYNTGGWLGFIDLALVATKAHQYLDQSPGDHDEHPILPVIFKDLGVMFTVACHHHPQFIEDVLAVAQGHLPPPMLDDLRTEAPGVLADLAGTAASLHAVPFDDANDVRTLTWAAAGVTWQLRMGNTTEERRAGERLASTLQVLGADLAGTDLGFLPNAFSVDVVLGSPGVRETGPSRLEAAVPVWSGGDHDVFQSVASETLVAAMSLIAHTSTAPRDEFMAVIAGRFEAGLASKIGFFRLHDDLMSDWSTNVRSVDLVPRLDQPEPLPAHPQMGVPDGPGPGYSTAAATEALTNRYENAMRDFSVTIGALAAEEAFARVVSDLRSRGWLDWHILGAICSTAATFRTREAVDAGAHSWRDGILMTPEGESDSPVPTTEFSLDTMLKAHEGNNVVTLVSTWGRRIDLRAVPTAAVAQLLADRYGHYTDDVEHVDPFEAAR